jgi:hypothetical protein
MCIFRDISFNALRIIRTLERMPELARDKKRQLWLSPALRFHASKCFDKNPSASEPVETDLEFP